MSKRVDLLISMLVVAGGAVWLYLASGINQSVKNDPIGERGFPTALGVIFVLGGIAVTVRSFRRLRAEPEPWHQQRFNEPGDEKEYAASDTRPILVWGACVAWMLALESLGFLIVTPLFVGVELWLLKFRRPVHLITLSIGGSLLLWLIFDYALKLHLPGGLLAPWTDKMHLW